MSDDVSFLEWGFKGLVGVLLTVGGWLWVMLIKAVGKNKDDLAEHKLYVSNYYIKKDVVDRIHDRLDNINNKMDTMDDKINDKMDDIKNMLLRVNQP